jgi:endonuclease YncB( thermonuclease family)
MQNIPVTQLMQMRFLIFAALIVATPCAAATAPFYGLAQAKDGDSLMIDDREVRLFGIDAPEWDQTCKRAGKQWSCGQEAASQLSKLVTGKQARCVAVDTDEHGRTVARCTVGTVDVNRQMVSNGYAIAYRRYSLDYVSAEASAKAAKRGIWAGTFEMPSDVRHAAEEQPAKSVRSKTARSTPTVSSLRSSPQPSGNCVIKGNRNSRGEWIYHMPGMPFYARTNPEEMFCTEAEARAAGYRRAKVR